MDKLACSDVKKLNNDRINYY